VSEVPKLSLFSIVVTLAPVAPILRPELLISTLDVPPVSRLIASVVNDINVLESPSWIISSARVKFANVGLAVDVTF